MDKIFSVVGMICLHLMAFTCVAHSQVSATLSAQHSFYPIVCPAEIKFKGTITSKKPGKVQYRFIRSDGTLLPVETIEFGTPGAKEVKGSWIAGDASTPLFEEWQLIRIVYPEEVESSAAKFQLSCDEGAPDLAVKF